jgi:hypothetical protein
MLEARSEVDKDLAMLNGNTAQFRLSEDNAFLEAMNQTQATTMFYGNPATDPKQFLGLATRYSSTSAGNGTNIISGGASSGALNTSVYLVVWGDNTVYCPFPKGSKAGLVHEDLGEQTVYDGVNRMQAYATRYQWKSGLVVKDWRYVVRIPNLLVADIVAGTGTQAASAGTQLTKLMMRAMYKIPNLDSGRAAFYMNRTVHSGLAVQSLDRSQAALAVQPALSQFGTARNYLSFQGIPIRRVDCLLNTEAVVS